MDIIRLILMIL